MPEFNEVNKYCETMICRKEKRTTIPGSHGQVKMFFNKKVEPKGLEPSTSSLPAMRSPR